MASRDKHCTATGCTIPAAFCHAHHKHPWAKGGETSRANNKPLCKPCHTRKSAHERATWDDIPYRDSG